MSRSSVALVLIGVIVFLMLWSVYTRTNSLLTQSINNLNATTGAGQRSLHLMTFTANGTKTLRVTVPSLSCASDVNWSILPNANSTACDGTIKIGTTAGDDDFGTETLTDQVSEDSGTIARASDIVDSCSTPTNGTATLFFTVNITTGTPVTFLFEVVSKGYYETVVV